MTEQFSPDLTAETLPVVAYKNVRVITTDLLATIYGTRPKNIHDNFANNEDRFVSGKHFFKLEGDELREFKNLHKHDEIGLVEISPRVKHLTLWTERGAARHAKILETDQAWEVFERLEDFYFRAAVAPSQPALDQALTLTPAEQQTLVEIAHARCAGCDPEIQGKALSEIWSRVHRKFRVAKYSQLPRAQFADAILYLTAMDVRALPKPPALEAAPAPALPAPDPIADPKVQAAINAKAHAISLDAFAHNRQIIEDHLRGCQDLTDPEDAIARIHPLELDHGMHEMVDIQLFHGLASTVRAVARSTEIQMQALERIEASTGHRWG